MFHLGTNNIFMSITVSICSNLVNMCISLTVPYYCFYLTPEKNIGLSVYFVYHGLRSLYIVNLIAQQCSDISVNSLYVLCSYVDL